MCDSQSIFPTKLYKTICITCDGIAILSSFILVVLKYISKTKSEGFEYAYNDEGF